MTEDLIKRVAKAIADNIQAALPSVYVHSIDYECAARAAIEAMREPTDAMHKAGNNELDAMEDGNGNAFCEHIWRSMIDAGLKEKP